MKNKRARRPTGVNALGQSAPADIVTVNDLAEKPNEHLGQEAGRCCSRRLTGARLCVLVDKREYADCGLSCLAEPATKKVAVRWSGDAPKLEQIVHVAGTLSQSAKGLSFVAQEVGIQ
jgi:hypothetical protein